MTGLYQTVVVTKLADRHASPGRSFAESYEVVVPAGPLPAVLDHVAKLVDLPVSRYRVTVSDPFTGEVGQ